MKTRVSEDGNRGFMEEHPVSVHSFSLPVRGGCGARDWVWRNRAICNGYTPDGRFPSSFVLISIGAGSARILYKSWFSFDCHPAPAPPLKEAGSAMRHETANTAQPLPSHLRGGAGVGWVRFLCFASSIFRSKR
jgi:hypothetical protein